MHVVHIAAVNSVSGMTCPAAAVCCCKYCRAKDKAQDTGKDDAHAAYWKEVAARLQAASVHAPNAAAGGDAGDVLHILQDLMVMNSLLTCQSWLMLIRMVQLTEPQHGAACLGVLITVLNAAVGMLFQAVSGLKVMLCMMLCCESGVVVLRWPGGVVC